MSTLTEALTQAAGTTDLVLVKAENAVDIFTKGGLNAVLDDIEAKVRAVKLDPSTAAGREDIRSTAYKVVRAKTTLDVEGKKLTEGWRAATALVNAERKRSSERLEALADEIRRPLTEFENKEKNRVAAHEKALSEISGLLTGLQSGFLANASAQLLSEHLEDYKTQAEFHPNRDWEEFSDRAKKMRADTIAAMVAKIEERKKFEADQAELERLRALEAARIQAERDKQLQAEAAECQRLESERIAAELAAKERQRVEAEAERVRLEAERRATEAQEKIDAAAKALKDAEAKAEADRKAAEVREQQAREQAKKQADKAAADLLAAQEKAARDAEAAAQREREKIDAERKAEEAARLKREADQKHKAKIRAEIVEDLGKVWRSELGDIADALMVGKVRNVKVEF